MVTLQKKQIQDALNDYASKGDKGISDIIEMVYNAIMINERQTFLVNENDPKNKANGFRPVKQAAYGRQLRLAIPRDRLGTFKPILMAALREDADQINTLAFELYREGLTTRRISKIFETIYKKHYDCNTISAMSNTFKDYLEDWRERKLDTYYPIILIDCIEAKVRRGTVSSEAFYVVLGVKDDYTREVLAIENNPTEGAENWKEVIQNLKKRGVEKVDLVVADGLQGLEKATLSIFPDARFQKCVTHLMRNALRKTKTEDKKAIAADLKPIFETTDNTHTKEKAYTMAEKFLTKWGKKYPKYKTMFSKENIRCYLTFLDFHYKIRSMVYTTNWIERLNKEFRRALKIRNSMPNVDSVLFLLSAIARDMEQGTYKYRIEAFDNEPIFG